MKIRLKKTSIKIILFVLLIFYCYKLKNMLYFELVMTSPWD